MSEETIPRDNLPEGEPPSETPPSIPELDEFIFEPDEYTRGVVPRKLSPQEVAKYLLAKIKPDTKLQSFAQVELVAHFYDTFEVTKKFRQFLQRQETSAEEVRRSIIIDRIIARLGDAEDRQFATQYYRHLVQKAETAQEFEDLILLHEALNLGGNSTEIRQKIQSKIDALQTKKDADYQAMVEYYKFQETILGNLSRAERVAAIKNKIVGTTDRQQRLVEEIKAYLTIEYGFIEFLQPWAARRIRQETWTAHPPEDAKRVDAQPLKDDVIKAFQTFLGKLNEFPTLRAEEKESVRLRALRAIKFFGGKLSEEEESFLDRHKGTQADTLANEGFMLK